MTAAHESGAGEINDSFFTLSPLNITTSVADVCKKRKIPVTSTAVSFRRETAIASRDWEQTICVTWPGQEVAAIASME